MGKSFNDDVFNDLDVANINGLNISKEAIEENIEKNKAKIDLTELGLDNIDELKKEYQKKKATKKRDLQAEKEEILKNKQEQEEKAKILEELEQKQKEAKEEKEQTVKRTMIFKKEHLDIIDGLTIIYQDKYKDKKVEKKDILKQIIDKGLESIDPKMIEKALKTKKPKNNKEEISIF